MQLQKTGNIVKYLSLIETENDILGLKGTLQYFRNIDKLSNIKTFNVCNLDKPLARQWIKIICLYIKNKQI